MIPILLQASSSPLLQGRACCISEENLQISHKLGQIATFLWTASVIECTRKIMRCMRRAPNRVIARRRSRRGNLREVAFTRNFPSIAAKRLPRPLRGLAMTGEIEAQAQTIDHICHCEASKKPWQSHGSNGREISGERYFPEIAASASPPRNDRVGGRIATGLRPSQ